MRDTLGNGLTVILERQPAAPVVAMQVWVKAGSADETPEEAGLAHLHEHMLFKGTGRRGLGEIARDVEARGGEINAWTSFDQTVYHLVLASSFYEDGLDILADAVRCSAFDPAELASEIEVVVEEIKRSNDLPSRKVSRAMFATAYSRHPYRHPVLGTEASVRSFTRQKVLDFFSKHYTPDNMAVVLVGDLDERRALAEVDRHFGGDWNRTCSLRPARAEEPVQMETRVALARDDIRETHLALSFPVPGVASPDVAALDVWAVLLSQGEGARLTAAMKLDRALASEVYAYAYTPRDPGLFVAGATLAPEKTEEALSVLLGELYRTHEGPVSEEEIVVAKAIVEADRVYGRETVQGVARKLGYYETVAGGLGFEEEYHARVAALTRDDLVDIARRTFLPERLTFTGLLSDGGPSEERLRALVSGRGATGGRTRPFRARSPAADPPVARAVPRAVDGRTGVLRAKLASGATVLVRRERAVPLVAFRAVYPGGVRYESEATNGLSTLCGRTMTRGTATRSAMDIAREIDELAGSLHGNAGRSSLGLRGEFLASHFDRALRLFADCLTTPAFRPEELERERTLQLLDIASRDDNPSGSAFDLFARTLYTRHPYRMDVLGEAPALTSLTREHLEGMRALALDPSRLTLAVVGDVDEDRALCLCDDLFGKSGGPPPPAPAVQEEPPQASPRRSYRELEKAQAHLIYGFLGVTVDSPDRHALDVLSSALSGQGGRLFLELRDKRSLAYSISSFSVEGLDPGYFGIYMGTSPAKVGEALAGIVAQLDRVVQSPIPEPELHRARRYLIGAHAIGLQRNSARAAIMAFDECYGLGADAFARYEEQIQAVTPEKVLEIARRIIRPAQANLAILGPRAADVGL